MAILPSTTTTNCIADSAGSSCNMPVAVTPFLGHFLVLCRRASSRQQLNEQKGRAGYDLCVPRVQPFSLPGSTLDRDWLDSGETF